MGDHLDERLKGFDKNSLEHLYLSRSSLLVIDGTDLTDARKCLKVVKSPEIRDLGYPGASGLLALIFKEWFGTVERPGTELSCCPKSKTIRDIAAWLKRKEEWKQRDVGFLMTL